MAREEFKGTRPDGRGVELCCNCWDGYHYINNFSNCLQGARECPCVKLMLEKANRVTPKQRKAFRDEHQTTISTEYVLDFIEGQAEPITRKA